MLRTVTLFLIAILPFQIALSPIPGFDIPFTRIIILLCGIFIAFIFFQNKPFFLPRSLIPVFLLIILGLFAASGIVATESSWYLRKLFFLCNYAIFFVCVLLTHDMTLYDRAMRILVCGGALSAFLALLLWSTQFIVGPEATLRLWGTLVAPLFLGQTTTATILHYSSAYVALGDHNVLRANGTFPDPHVAAFYWELLIPWGCAFFFGAHTWKKRFLWLFATALLLLGCIATFTRGAYVGIFFGIISACFALLWYYRAKITLRMILFFFVGISTLFIIGITPPIGSRIASLFGNFDSSITERFSIWRETIDIIRDNPLLGVGLGNYPLSIAPHASYRDPYYAHNLFLDLAVEGGIILAFLWIGTLILAIWRYLRYHSIIRGIAGASSLCILIAHGLFDTPLFSIHVLPVILILLAYASTSPRNITDIPSLDRVHL